MEECSDLCWKDTPLMSLPEKFCPSSVTPRVMILREPVSRVEAAPCTAWCHACGSM
jgi:hypothetical protein